MPSFFQILIHTPLWVWPLLALIVWLGLRGLKPRTMAPWQLAILPLVGLATSASGIAQSALPGVSLLAWLAALFALLPVGRLLGRRQSVRRLDGGRLEIGRGWFTLVFGLSIFAARYVLGVVFGLWPALRADPTWLAAAGLVGGAVAGLGLGWLTGLLGGFRRTVVGLASVALLIAAAVGSVIAFDSPARLPRLAAGDTLPGVESWNRAEIPPVAQVAARDGAPLTYRLYPGDKARAVVLVHGSSGASISMHKSAQALQAAGATVYAISLRGHGGSGTTNGDTSYRRQLDDDLVDFIKAVGLTEPGIHRTLVGFSSGGGFVLRTASGPNRAAFDAYLAISPYIAFDSPTSRPNAGGWVSVAVPRSIALSVLDGIGLPWFQGLPVVRFATAAAPSESRTPAYSFRLLTGMHLPPNWRPALARIARPTAVIVGDQDELFQAERFQPLLAELNPRIAVTVVPGFGHMDMITRPQATAAVATAWRRLAGERPVERPVERFDFKVREDMFAGFDGDREAFDRAMKAIEAALAADPDSADALAWRGAATLFLASTAFQRGDIAEGRRLSTRALGDLDRAVALRPNAISVHAARGPALLPYARGLRPFDRAEADRLTRLAMSDFDFIVAAKSAEWGGLAAHDRGELLGALAEGWLQLGEPAKAGSLLDRMSAELPGTLYAKNAAVRRADRAAKAPLTCLGCH